jgi:hypothetical protein
VLRDCSSRSDRHVFLETIVAHDFSFLVGFSNAGVDCRSRGIESKHEAAHRDVMKTAYLEEVNPWQAQVLRSDLAAKKLGLHEGLWKILREPTRELIVHVPVQMDDGTLEIFTGFRVQA